MSALPEDFLQFMRDVYGTEAANAWLQRLPSFLEECAERWQLTILPPFENLSLHYVAPAVRASFPMNLNMGWPRYVFSMDEASLVS